MFRIGIDLGGTKIEGIVLDDGMKEVCRERIPTEQEGGYDHILRRIGQLHETLVSRMSGDGYTLGIGTPGTISPATGLLNLSNTVCMNGMPVATDLEKMLGRKVAIQNDANCFAMAEAALGAGRGRDLVFGVIMGTGCGGGIVYKGEVITGLQGKGGEWGHMSIDPSGPECFCGRRGCVETFISGSWQERRYKEKFGEKKKSREIVDMYRAGDAGAGEIMKDFLMNFGRAIANLITVMDPDIIVIGGGVSNIDELYTLGVEEVAKCFDVPIATPIVKNELGDSAGVIGAALIGI